MANTQPPTTADRGSTKPRPSLGKRIFKWLAITLLVLIVAVPVIGYLAIPALVSSMAPGMIKDAAGKQITGGIEIGKLSTSWSGPTQIQGLQLKDAAGKPIANLSATSTLGIWSGLKTLTDLGSFTLSGDLNVVRTIKPDGTSTTNLQDALAKPGQTPAQQAAAASKPAGESAPLPDIKLNLDLSKVNITYLERLVNGQTVQEAAVKDLTGKAVLATRPGSADINLKAGFATKIDTAPTGALTLDAKVQNFADASGKLAIANASIDAKGTITNVPVGLVDALTSASGLLSGALGAQADVQFTAKGTMQQAQGDLKLTAPGATADLGMAINAGRLTTTRPGQIQVQSLAFLQNLPAAAEGLAKAGITIDRAPSGWPGLSATIQQLDVPMDVKSTQWAPSKFSASIITSGPMRGMLRAPGSLPTDQPRPLLIQPVNVEVRTDSPQQGAIVKINTSATVGGESAGRVNVEITTGSLLGPTGNLPILQGSLPAGVNGRIELADVATNLLSPFLAGTPLELQSDIGPSLTLLATAKATGEGIAGQLPPTDFDVTLRSANVQLETSLGLTSTSLSTRNENTLVRVLQAGPLLRRMVQQQNTGKAPQEQLGLTGQAAIELRVPKFSMPIVGSQFQSQLINADVIGAVRDITLRLPPGKSAPMGTAPMDVALSSLQASAAIRPSEATPMLLQADAIIAQQPVKVAGKLTADGLLNPADRQALAILGPRRFSGSIDITGLSGQVVSALAQLPTGSMPSELANTLLATPATISINLIQGVQQSGQPIDIKLTTTPGGTTASFKGELRREALIIDGVDASATITPALATMLLRQAGQSDAALAGARLREGASLALRIAPTSIPLQAGTFTPALANAPGNLALSVSLDRPAILDGILVDGRNLSAGVAQFGATAATDLSAIDSIMQNKPDAMATILQKTRSELRTDLIGASPADLIARINGSLGFRDDTKRATFELKAGDVIPQRLDDILATGGLLGGLLGDSLSFSLVAEATDQTAQSLAITAQIKSPRMAIEALEVSMNSEVIALHRPVKVQATLDPQVIKTLMTPASTPATSTPANSALPGPAFVLTSPAPVTLEINRFGMARTKRDETGRVLVGPMKPGLFSIDAKLTAPAISLQQTAATSASTTTPAPASGPIAISSLIATIASSPTTGGIDFQLTAESIRQGTLVVQTPTTIKAALVNLSDATGALNTQQAVVSLDVATGQIPSALIDTLASQNGRLQELLGEQLVAQIQLSGYSLAGAGTGSLRASFTAPNAGLQLAGPIVQGVLDTTQPGSQPLKAELKQFKFQGGKELLSIFPLFAGVERKINDLNTAPSMIQSRDLKLPMDGNLANLSGVITVDIGRVDYTFSDDFGRLLDATVFAGGRGMDQKPIPPFSVNLDRGIATYDNVELPVRNFTFRTKGRVDLVKRELDVITFVPTLAAAPGLLANANKAIGDTLGRLIPNAAEKLTALPLRTRGSLDNPQTSLDLSVVADQLKDTFKPENILNTVGGIVGGLLGEEDKKNQPKQPAQPAPGQPAPGAPQPAGPAGPSAPPAKPDDKKDDAKDKDKEKKDDKPLFPFPIPLPTR
jgi:hypothetical protein